MAFSPSRNTASFGNGPLNVRAFGAVGDGVTNDTAAIQAAHNTGRVIYYPAGTYLITPTITIAAGGIVGEGPSNTIITSTEVGSANFYTFTGALDQLDPTPTFRDFSIVADITKSGGAGIQVLPTSGEASYLDFRNVQFAYLPIGIDFVAASLWKVIGCSFLAYTIAGIQVANTNTPDSGDSVITGCVFNNPYATGSGVWQKSSGGLKIVGNKFLGGQRGYTMNLEGTTGALMITGNSFENMADSGLSFSRATVGQTFANVVISGNEFSVGTKAIATDGTGFMSNVCISANQINMGAVGSNACISLDSVTDFFVGSNMIRGNGGAGSSAVSINNCTTGKIGRNTYANLPNPISVTSSPTVTVDKDQQAGTVATATSGWTAYGSTFKSPLQTVTFDNPFLVTPALADVSLTPTGGSGEIGAIAVSVSKTQITFNVLSVNTSIAAQCNWRVHGIL
jgi:hypothetical protein